MGRRNFGLGSVTPPAFRKGDRVQAHPATDTWMRGDRYGTVESIGRKFIGVRMDISGRLVYFTPANILDT